jgi:hypothetical protein
MVIMRILAGGGVWVLLLSAALGCSDGKKNEVAGPVDPGITVAKVMINATTGGTYPLPGGAVLIVAPLALPQDTEITIKAPKTQSRASRVQKWDFQPSGLTFKTPATLRVPYDKVNGVQPIISGFMASPAQPIRKAGLELTNAVGLDAVARDEGNGTIDVILPHFTFVMVLIQVDRYIYVVPEIPSRYLQPADMLFVLTLGDSDPGPNWNPGHVGIFTGGSMACLPPSSDSLVESTPPMVRTHNLMSFRTGNGHQYLGARRPAGTALSSTERKSVTDFCSMQVGKPYSLVFGQGNVGSSDPMAGLSLNGGFSCIGLAEAAHDTIGRGSLEVREGLIATPLELYDATVPVEEFTMGVGEILQDMRVRNIVVHPGSPYIGTMLRGWYCDGYPCASPEGDAVDPDSELKGTKPDTLTFTQSGRGHYVINYTAIPEDAGKSFDMTIETKAFIKFSTPFGAVNIGQQVATARLKINVVPCSGVTPPGCFLPTDPPRTQVACLVGGDEGKTISQKITNSVALTQGGTHGNSNTVLPHDPILAMVDLFFGTSYAQEFNDFLLQGAFLNTYFPCGAGTYGTTLCPVMDTPGKAGRWFVIQTQLGADVPLKDSVYSYQYGFVFDADDDPGNNYQADPRYADDYYQGTDRWYSAEYSPQAGWQLKVSDARNGQIRPVTSSARLVISGSTMSLFVPATEFSAVNPGYRITAFRHKGDYGQMPPHDYSADTHPPVRMPLRRVSSPQ